jgi:hypothetical protein
MQTQIDHLKKIYEATAAAAAIARRRPEEIRLVGVSKRQPIPLIREFRRAGLTDFGESYVQEFLDKYEELKDDAIEWHFIGHLQSNKVKYIIDKVRWIHSVDSVKLAEEIQRQAEKQGVARINILLQINVGGEESKSGTGPDGAIALYRAVKDLDRIAVRGLMTLPPFLEPEAVRPYFRQLRELRDRILREEQADSRHFTELSMGMSNDFDVAIEEGATMIRLGTILFGERD